VYDLPLSHTLMYELWTAMTGVCSYGLPRPERRVEDVPHNDPFYHVYSVDRHRFELPPTCSVEMPWLATPRPNAETSAALSQPPSPAKAVRGTLKMSALRGAARDALVGSTNVIADLNAAELQALSKIVGHGADPGDKTELTDRDLRFIEGAEATSGFEDEDDPFGDDDDEEESDYDSGYDSDEHASSAS
jgi:hypothetical protein